MASRGDRTREHLLDVAEALFGAEGVANVSLRQIRLAAGQGNEAAVQYHFGDRDGIIRALSERHTPRVEEIRDRIMDGGGRRPSQRTLVEAFVRPLAEYGTRGPSERSWSKMLPDLLVSPRLSLETIQEHSSAAAAQVGITLYGRLSTKMPEQIAGERLWAVTQFVVHVVADRARLVDDPQPARPISPDDQFIDNLVEMAYGALTARHASTPRVERGG